MRNQLCISHPRLTAYVYFAMQREGLMTFSCPCPPNNLLITQPIFMRRSIEGRMLAAPCYPDVIAIASSTSYCLIKIINRQSIYFFFEMTLLYSSTQVNNFYIKRSLMHIRMSIVAYLFKASTAEPEKQPLLCNSCVNTTVLEPSLGNIRTQQQRNFWKWCFLCGRCQGYIRSQLCIVSYFTSVASREFYS